MTTFPPLVCRDWAPFQPDIYKGDKAVRTFESTLLCQRDDLILRCIRETTGTPALSKMVTMVLLHLSEHRPAFSDGQRPGGKPQSGRQSQPKLHTPGEWQQTSLSQIWVLQQQCSCHVQPAEYDSVGRWQVTECSFSARHQPCCQIASLFWNWQEVSSNATSPGKAET